MKESSLFTPGTLALFQIGKSVLIGTLFYTIRAMSQSLEIPANLGAKGCDCTGHIAEWLWPWLFYVAFTSNGPRRGTTWELSLVEKPDPFLPCEAMAHTCMLIIMESSPTCPWLSITCYSIYTKKSDIVDGQGLQARCIFVNRECPRSGEYPDAALLSIT